MGKRYKSRQLLNFSGRIYVKIRISDHNGNWSLQEGVSYQGNVQRTFNLGISEAVTHALYKHFYKFGRPIVDSKNVSLSDFIRDYDLKDWYVLYITEDSKYTFKTTLKNNKRYFETRYKGQLQLTTRFKPTSRIRVDNIINGLDDIRKPKIVKQYEEQIRTV